MMRKDGWVMMGAADVPAMDEMDESVVDCGWVTIGDDDVDA